MANLIGGIENTDVAHGCGQCLTLRVGKAAEEAIFETGIGCVVLAKNGFYPGFIKIREQSFGLSRLDNAVEAAFLFGLCSDIRPLPLLRRILKFPPVGTFQCSRVVTPRAAPVGKAVQPPWNA